MSSDHDYETVWREAGPTLWRAVRAYAGGREDVADDAVAEAFARVIAHDGEVRDPVAYLYRVAFRVAASELQQMKTHELDETNGPPTLSPAERAVDLWRALTELPPTQRAVLYLYYRADLPVREVSRRLGISNAAVRTQLVRGRRRLASLLSEEDR